jgi:Zn-finger domain-containing protein
MGKLQLQWAHIALAPIAGSATMTDSQEELLLRGMTHYAQAIAYFLQFSQELRWHKEAFERIYNHLKIYGIQRLQKVRNRVEEVEREYHVSLTPLLKEIDETLALKPQLVS